MSSALRDNLIKVAFNTDKPKLKRELVALVTKKADYPDEFIDWMQAKGPVFENPSTGNKVKFLSLDSHSQAVAANKWKPEWEKELESAKKKRETEEPEEKAEPAEGEQGQFSQFQTSKFKYRGKGKSKDKKVLWQEGDLDKALPEKIRAQYQSMFENADYNTLLQLLQNVETALGDWDAVPLYQESGYTEDGMKSLQKMLRDRLKDVQGRMYTDNAGQHGVNHDFGEETMDNLYDWRKAKPATGRKLSWQQLREKFIKEAHLDAGEAKKVRGMSPDEFKHMYLAVLDADGVEEEDEEIFEEGGKMAADETEEAEEEGTEEAEEEEDEKKIEKEKKDEDIEEKGGDEELISIFDEPRAASKKPQTRVASFGRIRELMIRSAYHTTDPETKQRLLRMLKADDMDEDSDFDDEDEAGEDEPLDEEESEGEQPAVMASYQEIRELMIRSAYGMDNSPKKRRLVRMLQVGRS